MFLKNNYELIIVYPIDKPYMNICGGPILWNFLFQSSLGAHVDFDLMICQFCEGGDLFKPWPCPYNNRKVYSQ